MKKLVLLTAFLMTSLSVFAGKLDDAKASGLIGEKPDGYLGVVVSSPATQKLVTDINAKRKAKYLELAKKNKISLQQVQSLAAEKTFSKTLSGHYLFKNGKWVKK